MTFRDRAFVWLQYLLPQHTLSALVNRATRWRWRPWKNALIRAAIARFRIDLSEAENAAPDAYVHFNAFFTRALVAGARPLDESDRVFSSPCDGVISQIGPISGQRLIQAKGRDYSLGQLLTDQVPWREHCDGQFATIYLSPRDYHRVHMPISGVLQQTVYVPGRLFSVAPATTRAIPSLFARNERLVCWFDTAAGSLAVVLVGAVCVSAIDCVWCGAVPPARQIRHTDYRGQGVELARGAELGRFNMGSTVIVTAPPQRLAWNNKLSPQVSLRMGQTMGQTMEQLI